MQSEMIKKQTKKTTTNDEIGEGEGGGGDFITEQNLS